MECSLGLFVFENQALFSTPGDSGGS
ncbi:hypothetical protein Godav_024449 [Gossypium davidsonii]|uniref:Uncharacterized protein n=2 Tax=Gossypium TaxID=3633 RepID=A0A7J8TFD3_GOSDV|nr:hypothetical protein [Gossypium davidsonii]